MKPENSVYYESNVPHHLKNIVEKAQMIKDNQGLISNALLMMKLKIRIEMANEILKYIR
jgi:hypothetical protein